MKIDILCAGHKLAPHEQVWIDEYSKRIAKFADFRIERVREKDGDTVERRAEKTWEELKRFLPGKTFCVVLDAKGKLFDTAQFLRLCTKAKESGLGRVTFVVGGSYGLPDIARKSADTMLSLSPLTLPHRLALLILVEQIYRVLSWEAGSPYHHE